MRATRGRLCSRDSRRFEGEDDGWCPSEDDIVLTVVVAARALITDSATRTRCASERRVHLTPHPSHEPGLLVRVAITSVALRA